MLFTSFGTFYSKVQFKTEEEVEKVVVDNFKHFFWQKLPREGPEFVSRLPREQMMDKWVCQH